MRKDLPENSLDLVLGRLYTEQHVSSQRNTQQEEPVLLAKH